MNWLDIVILAAVAFLALAGWRLGGVHVGVTGAGILAGIALATRLQDQVRPFFSRFTDNGNGAEIAAFTAIFVVVLVASIVVGFLLRALLSRLMLGWLDKVVGLGLAIVVTFAVGSAVLSTIQSYPVFGINDAIGASIMATFMADNFDAILRGLRFIPADLGV